MILRTDSLYTNCEYAMCRFEIHIQIGCILSTSSEGHPCCYICLIKTGFAELLSIVTQCVDHIPDLISDLSQSCPSWGEFKLENHTQTHMVLFEVQLTRRSKNSRKFASHDHGRKPSTRIVNRAKLIFSNQDHLE